MYAIIQDGGKQFKVAEGDVILVDKRDLAAGDAIEFEKVALVSDGKKKIKVGTPLVKDAVVRGEVLGEEKGKKIRVFFYRRRKDSRRTKGHRQKYLRVRINEVKAG